MSDEMFAPPVNRAMKVLDRGFFQKTVPTTAARIFNVKDISRCRKELEKSRDALLLNRIQPIRPDPCEERAQKGGKCILLRPDIVRNGTTPPHIYVPGNAEFEQTGRSQNVESRAAGP
jgi:tRNA (guanine37-N1)-methyltransferase